MFYLNKIKNKISKNSLLVILVAILCCYFFYYTINGNNGVFRYFAIKNEIKNKVITKKKLEKDLSTQKEMIKSIQDESLDLDLLDEKVRENLGHANDGEIVIYEK